MNEENKIRRLLFDSDEEKSKWLDHIVDQDLIEESDSTKVYRHPIEVTSILDEYDASCERHYFAGIGGWPLAIDMANLGWLRDYFHVWTGSAPCQPFSRGNQSGSTEGENLFSIWFEQIAKKLPDIVIGEQVVSKKGRKWFANVRDCFSREGYEIFGIDLPACIVGSPMRRQRLYWLAVHKESFFNKLENVPKSTLESFQNGSSFLENSRPWSDTILYRCSDGYLRPAPESPAPLGENHRLREFHIRGYGDAVVPQCAGYFLEVFFKGLFTDVEDIEEATLEQFLESSFVSSAYDLRKSSWEVSEDYTLPSIRAKKRPTEFYMIDESTAVSADGTKRAVREGISAELFNDLGESAKLRGWATLTRRDEKDYRPNDTDASAMLGRQVWTIAFRRVDGGWEKITDNPDYPEVLSDHFARWIMGYPYDWSM